MLLLTGALTSKPYAFTSRPWELRSVQSIDILDGLGSNIRIDFKESEIVRILPRRNFEINENWISDKIRFFYDGLKRQRITTPYTKIKGELKPIKWSKALNKVSSLLKVCSFEYGTSRIGFVSGSTLDLETLFTIRHLTSNYNFSYLGTDAGFSVNLDDPKNYKFQNTLNDFENIDYCLFIGTNPRFEASLLNVRLRKVFRRGNLSFASVGSNFNTTFPIDFLGLSSEILVSIVEGTHPLCKVLAKAKNPVIVYGSKLLERQDSSGIFSLFNSLNKSYTRVYDKSLFINVLSSEANSVGSSELGICSAKKDSLKNFKLVYAVGIENQKFFKEIKKLSPNSFFVLQSSHGNSNTNLADVVLSSTTFAENSGIYYNVEGRPQKTQRAFIGPNLSRDNWKIISILFQTLGKFCGYSTKSQIVTELSRILPSAYYSNTWFTVKTKNLSLTFGEPQKERILKTSFKLFLEDFYMTHILCQSSKVMAKASESLRSYSNNYKSLANISFKK